MSIINFVNPEVKIIESSPERLLMDCYFSNEDIAFKGHYPGNPILPASLIIEFCCRQIQIHLSVEQFFTTELSVSRADFFKAIKPDQEVLFSFSFNQLQPDCRTVEVLVSNVTEVISKIKFCTTEQKINYEISRNNTTDGLPALDHLPQRYPLLVVDRVFPQLNNEQACAVKYVSYGDYCYRNTSKYGLSQQQLSYPIGGIVEGLEQSATLLLEQHWPLTDSDKVIVIGGISGIQFAGTAYPGDAIYYYSNLYYLSENNAIISGCAMVNERIIMVIDKIFVVMGKSKLTDE